MIDHTQLDPSATTSSIEKTCEEAIRFGTHGVCVNPAWIPLIADRLRMTRVNPVSVVSFPFGSTTPTGKVFEAKQAIEDGAKEIDVVANLGWIAEGSYEPMANEIRRVVSVAHEANAKVKVILESALLDRFQLKSVCQALLDTNVDFIKTNTGFAGHVTTPDQVAAIRSVVKNVIGIKASGGIHTFDTAMAVIRAGANRIGSSRSVDILKGFPDVQ